MKKFIKRILRERREQVNKARGKRKAFVPCGVMDFCPDFFRFIYEIRRSFEKSGTAGNGSVFKDHAYRWVTVIQILFCETAIGAGRAKGIEVHRPNKPALQNGTKPSTPFFGICLQSVDPGLPGLRAGAARRRR